MSKKVKGFKPWESAKLNNSTYLDYYNRLVDLSINMWEWKNLPDTVDERFLELTLFSQGFALFFEDEEIGHLALQCAMSGTYTIYNIPTNRRAYAANGYNKDCTLDDSVIIYNNRLRTSSMLETELYALRLYELERSIDVNVKAQKTPLMILCDEEQRLTMRNLMQQYEGNEPFIFGTKRLDTNEIKPIITQAPFVADKLQSLKRQVWSEALTFLGIENVNNEKREHLISDEVNYNLGNIMAQRFTKLNARKQACNEINKMFGLNIDVEFRSKFQLPNDISFLNEFTSNDINGGEINE